MEKNQHTWHKAASAVYTAHLVYAVVAILSAIATLFATKMMVSDILAGHRFGTGFLVLILFGLISLAVAAWIVFTLGNFKKVVVHAEDQKSVGHVYLGWILQLVGALFVSVLVFFAPFLALLGGICALVGWILALSGYMKLKASSTFPAQARKGASLLFLAMVVMFCGAIVMMILGRIPVVGIVLQLAIILTGYAMMVLGWKDIKESKLEA